MLKGCVVSACNYLAVVRAKHILEPDFWAKILLVRFEDNSAGHAYCVWETDGTIYGYDRNSGGFPIPTYTKDPMEIASILAVEFSKHLGADVESYVRGFRRAREGGAEAVLIGPASGWLHAG